MISDRAAPRPHSDHQRPASSPSRLRSPWPSRAPSSGSLRAAAISEDRRQADGEALLKSSMSSGLWPQFRSRAILSNLDRRCHREPPSARHDESDHQLLENPPPSVTLRALWYEALEAVHRTARVAICLRAHIENRGSHAFVPAVLEPGPEPAPAHVKVSEARRRGKAAAAVELEIDGVVVKIARGADATLIAAVIQALKS